MQHTNPVEMHRGERDSLRCPACGGAFLQIEQRCRCSRCRFTMCDNCEGESPDAIDFEVTDN